MGLTQKELGDIIGVSQQIVSRMERDRDSISVDVLIQLAEVFRVSTDCVLGYGEMKDTVSHLIYMDIEMEQMDGLEAAERIREYDAVVPLIFVTGHDTYALRGYDVMSMAYLLKPIDGEKFIQVFERALGVIRKNDKLFIFENLRSYIKVPMKEILYFQSNNKKVEMHLKNGREEFTAKLDDVERQLERSGFEFLRIHKSYLVNFKHIMRINGDRVVLTNGKTLQISERYCARVKARYLHFVEMRK